MHQAAVGQLPETRHAFVDGVIDFEVFALPVFATLPPVVEPDEEGSDGVPRASTDHYAIALYAASLIDQGGGGGPQGIVEHGLV